MIDVAPDGIATDGRGSFCFVTMTSCFAASQRKKTKVPFNGNAEGLLRDHFRANAPFTFAVVVRCAGFSVFVLVSVVPTPWIS